MPKRLPTPGLRAKKQRSGRIYYYLEIEDRKQIPLGSDYILAVQKWAELTKANVQHGATFIDVIEKYEREALPLLATSTQATQKYDIKHLRDFFGKPSPAPLDAIKPSHIAKLLEKHRTKPQTANRLKRLFSAMFNRARAWGYTDKENPATGVRGLAVGKREVYVTDQVFKAIWDCATAPIRDAMDLAYLTGQRPSDSRAMTDEDIADGTIPTRQGKTGTMVRIRIEGELAALIKRINARKETHKTWTSYLLVSDRGKPMSKQMIRKGFEDARSAAAEANPDLADAIKEAWLYDLRAKAADDTADARGEQSAADLLGHANVSTTKRHYLRRGKIVGPTK
ncbi:tyrosine-type recombinase/integrase [Curvibacter lanceolatus]|uniref:tyrosine-type recombinase/integrase n=1 Tax=Curvibacter lanceolatus TaxID=86182 RepID=UPI00035CC327|nr:tyrosine-type recombinase/integrase [Curvibacter lanceolatus]